MYKLSLAICATALLSACGGASNNAAFLSSTGNDVSFLQQGVTSCPNIDTSNNPIYERYPLRCGPQAQVIPR